MPGPLEHAPSHVLLEYLVAEGFGVDPDDDEDGAWPIFKSRHPDRPDDLIRITDTEGISNGDTQVDGERQEQHGVQILVRGVDDAEIFGKIRAIAVHLDRIKREVVDVPSVSTGTGSSISQYIIHAMQRTSGVIALGTDVPQGKRFLYTVNYLCSIRQCC